MFRTRLWLCVAVLLPALMVPPSRLQGEDLKSQLDAVTLPDCFGKPTEIRKWSDSRIVVVAFLGTECPLAKLYGSRLQQLSERFQQQGVQFVGVFSNVQDSLTEVVAYGNKQKVQFPLLLDSQQELADILGATRTPEVVLLDANRAIRYRGRIDDQYGIGVVKQTPTREDLTLALSALLEDKAIEVAAVPAVGCAIGRVAKSSPRGDITYTKDIAPIFNQRCVECHRPGEVAPFSLTSYEETIGWGATIAEVISEQRMPPWNANPDFGHFKNDARLSDTQKQTILTWIENGCPEGDAKDLPSPPKFVQGWRMPEPDMVIHASDKPFDVPATGTVDYQYFQVDPKFTEDKYVIAAEARPENPAVVHHIIAFLVMPGQRDIDLGKILIGYAPGTSPLIFPEGAAMRIPAGSKLLFEMHYTPNGVAQSDRSYIGIKFTDKANVRQQVVGLEALNNRFKIPPQADAHSVVAQEKFSEETLLLSVTPHMHLRGKAFRYEAKYPDGTTEVLLDVPKYDFNWQLRYEFAEPKRIPKGTVVTCSAVFDNSSQNPNNPDPTKTVTWGRQSWEEMMIGFFTGMRSL